MDDMPVVIQAYLSKPIDTFLSKFSRVPEVGERIEVDTGENSTQLYIVEGIVHQLCYERLLIIAEKVCE